MEEVDEAKKAAMEALVKVLRDFHCRMPHCGACCYNEAESETILTGIKEKAGPTGEFKLTPRVASRTMHQASSLEIEIIDPADQPRNSAQHVLEGEEFEVIIVKDSRTLGLDIALYDRKGELLVNKIKPGGLLEDWNETHDCQVEVGDSITMINGHVVRQMGMEEITNIMRYADEVRFVVRPGRSRPLRPPTPYVASEMTQEVDGMPDGEVNESRTGVE
mmetsp:Transcript_3106/g.6996  ORF Transcript_3106/g.6996 Transcript_3106/m.6996 type:complete len:219 (+) Transcript_3106:118-774(+)|eukprot:CAMPEP_0178420152 /NCGR_PEP_ID=MMETSP0689_2-20121128/25982_1 /TAXON_ID=160604 /ORGANISM="Amphidinium massartii, Strain CS-259" /LENGTH=218 /DNA_ID=CAMNT_0020041619 /DNA_START=28 /DNA_END=684 /DNA_ORIENTATION=-